MIGLIGDYVVLFTYGMVLIPWEVGPALWNGSGIQGEKVCCFASGK